MSAPTEDRPCPDDDTLLAYVAGALPTVEGHAIELHIDGCVACCEVLAEAGRAFTSGVVMPPDEAATPATPRRLPEPGDNVGRYHILEVLGLGAMGVVYAAYDPELDRRVAVKLVRVQSTLSRHTAELEARLLAEAQAMARLSHRNVVAVHDIGSIDGGVYIAMELVNGQSVRTWLQSRPSWRAIVEVFIQAAQGLAAAHEAGIVHRDFKPDNVLIDGRGRVLVTDFGLARIRMRDHAPVGNVLPSSDLRRTRAGTIIGTPAYMAPEQLDDGPVDARADVFAFGASLYEALYQARPYGGRTFAELEVSLRRGVPNEPGSSNVPKWVKRVVSTALAGDPARRQPSMQAVIDDLQRDPRKALLRVVVPLAALALVAGTVGAVWYLTTAEARACREGAERADVIWNESRARVRDAFERSGSALAKDGFEHAAGALRAHLTAWQGERVEACDATHERGEQSEALLDLRLRCLDQRLAEASALIDVFDDADPELVAHAPEAVAGLSPISVCAEVDRLRSRVPLPLGREANERVTQAQAALAQAEAAEVTGRWADGIALATKALSLAREAAYRPAEAEATLLLASLTSSSGDRLRARTLYEDALPLALAGGDDRVSAEAAIGIAGVISATTRNTPEALRWAALAEAESARIGNERELAAKILSTRADAHFVVLEADKATAELEAAVALFATEESPIAVELMGRLAGAYQQAERYADALATFERALPIAARALGPRHPRTLAMQGNYASCLSSAGRHGRAERAFAEVIAHMSAIYPPEHMDFAVMGHQRGAALVGLGRFDEAIASHRAAIAIETKLLGPEPGQLALSHSLLALAQARSGRGQEALASLATARDFNTRYLASNGVMVAVMAVIELIAYEALGRDDIIAGLMASTEATVRREVGDGTERAMIEDVFGRLLVRQGEPALAVPHHAAALALIERLYGKDNVELGPSLLGLGQALVATGQCAEAVPVLDRGVTVLTSEPSDPQVLAALQAARTQASTCATRPR